MNYFIIQDKLTGEYVCDVDEQMGVCWSKDKGERVVFVHDHKTVKFLSKRGMYRDCYFNHIEVDEDGFEV